MLLCKREDWSRIILFMRRKKFTT